MTSIAARSAAAVLLAALLPALARAQVVRGTVTDTVARAPVVGAVVRLVPVGRDTAGARFPAALTDPQGQFVLRAPTPGAWLVEAKRIGVRPERTGALELAAGETREVRLSVAPIQPRLAAVRVVDRAACGARVESAAETATLWEEVRAALTATRLTSESEPPVRLTRWSRRLHPRTGAVLADSQHDAVHGRARFAGVPGEVLSKRGYIVPSGDGWAYYAPDAEGLLSAAFVRDHCFRPMVSDSARGLVGLAFEPDPSRRLPDIAGVLWLDGATSELRRLEYRYTRLPHDVRHAMIGGVVEFARRANGTWLVRRWAVRMPEVGLVREPGRAAPVDHGPRPTVLAILEDGGEVVPAAIAAAARESAAAPEDAGGEPTIVGTLWDSAAARPLVGARVTVEGRPYASTTDEDGRYRLRLHDPGTYTVVAQHPRVDTLGVPRPRGLVRVPRGAATLDLALPPSAGAAALLCAGGVRPRTGVVHGRVAAVNAASLEGPWKLSVRWSERVRVGAGQAWHSLEGTGTLTADGPTRRFVLCDVPPGRELRGTLVRDGDRAEGELRVRLSPGEVVRRDVVLTGRP